MLRRAVCIAVAFISSTVAAVAGEPHEDPRLSTLPSHAYRINDEGKFQTESWYFELVVHDAQQRAWDPAGLKLETLAAGKTVKTTTVDAAALTSMRRRAYFPTPDLPAMSMRRHFSIADEVFDLPLVFSERRVEAIDQVRVTLTLKTGPTTVDRSLVLPIEKYVQKTKLTFPFTGPAIVTQGNFNNGGHVHRETIFAIDAMSLTPTYAPMLSEEETNETIAGWGKDILAPAAGTVVYSRNDVPTNPLYEMHMQAGSVTVRKGDAVKQGQVLGKLGNSGDAYMPHLHYQLTNGPLIFAADGLPMQFENLPGKTFTRGTYFNAK